MDNQNCYIEFDFADYNNFADLQSVFEKFKTAKNCGQPQQDFFWFNSFPDYSLTHFYFIDTDHKPGFQTAKKTEFTWHFYSLIELLQVDYEIEYVECIKLDENKGRLEYSPWSYPYGGVTGLLTLITSFKCRPIKYDDGTGIYKIDHLKNGAFKTIDLTKKKADTNENSLFTKFFKKLFG